MLGCLASLPRVRGYPRPKFTLALGAGLSASLAHLHDAAAGLPAYHTSMLSSFPPSGAGQPAVRLSSIGAEQPASKLKFACLSSLGAEQPASQLKFDGID